MVEVERGARHHRQDRWTQSKEYGVFGYLITLYAFPSYSYCYLWRRGEIYPQEVIIHKFGVRGVGG